MEEWPLRRVLMCTDFSEAANAATPYAVAIANKYAADLFILHVGVRFDHLLPPEARAAMGGGILEAANEETVSRLKEIELPKTKPRVVRCKSVWASSPTSGIIDFVEENEIDLVVLSSRGRQLVPGILLGSVARNVAAAAPCPVLCVRPPKKGAPPDPAPAPFRARRILVPTDGSERSLEAIRFAGTLARRYAGEVVVLHVFAVDLFLAGMSFGVSELLKGSGAELKADLRKRTIPYLKPLEDQGTKVVLAFSSGRPSEEIGSYAKEQDTDLIVMSRKGRRRTKHRLGGVPERLLRDMPCPVLLV